MLGLRGVDDRRAAVGGDDLPRALAGRGVRQSGGAGSAARARALALTGARPAPANTCARRSPASPGGPSAASVHATRAATCRAVRVSRGQPHDGKEPPRAHGAHPAPHREPARGGGRADRRPRIHRRPHLRQRPPLDAEERARQRDRARGEQPARDEPARHDEHDRPAAATAIPARRRARRAPAARRPSAARALAAAAPHAPTARARVPPADSRVPHRGHCLGRTAATDGGCASQALTSSAAWTSLGSLRWSFPMIVPGARRGECAPHSPRHSCTAFVDGRRRSVLSAALSTAPTRTPRGPAP